MATFTGFWHNGDQPSQELQFEASEELKDDIEELEAIMRSEMLKRFGKNTYMNAVVENIFIKLDEEAMLDQIIETVKNLDRYEDYKAVVDDGIVRFYDQNEEVEVFDAIQALENAKQQFEETGNSEAEIRYDGLKYFTVEIIY